MICIPTRSNAACQPGGEHKVYPCLLKNLNIDRPNQIWVADITCMPMGKGFLYLLAIMDG